ncbi:hypothetical protein NE604_06620 [Anaerofustis stercorihominis]|uniref:hypothetical protein n=1 Tax=Anaerofustis stercorihominis TaxID=214853 RepID=UPI002108E091|nr:hypothetical protein [Anaerofustis stercorihominis]MCQ4795309.1 hypothetical protein [Anaerofustis stercorihominis]
MGKYIILTIISFVIGFSLCMLISTKLKRKWDKEYADTLVMVLQEQFECAKHSGAQSGIHYMLDEKGLDYTIYYFGKVYTLIHSVKNKSESQQNIEKSLKTFLSGALAKDIQEYKEKMKTKESRMETLKQSLEKETKGFTKTERI